MIKNGLADTGIECLHQVIPVFSFYDSNKLIVFYNLAIGQWVTGLTDSARTTISEWQKLVDMFNSDLDRALILSVKGRLFAYEKKYSEAATALQDAIDMFQVQEETYYLIEAEAWLSLALYKMGEEQKASNLAHSVHQRLEQGENLGDLEFPYSITYCLVEVFRDREPDLAHRIAHIATEGINMFTVKLDDAEAEKGYTEYFFHKALLNFH